MRAGEDMLCIGESDGEDLGVGNVAEARMPAAHEVESVEIARSDSADEFFGLLPILFE
jgi:hypothetical protein